MSKCYFKWPDRIPLRRCFYDQAIYDSYIASVMEKPREGKYRCCCFAVFDDETKSRFLDALKDNQFFYSIPITDEHLIFTED